MASLNVADWSPDQVADWMSGLEASVARYAGRLRARDLAGARLLTLRCDDLEYLGVHAIGHQELLLEAVDHLRNFHYEMRRECVQQLAVRVSAAGSGLARALRASGGTGGAGGALETQALADAARLVSCVKPLVCWLDRWPLCSSPALAERRAALLKLSLEAATCAQRERFAEQPARAVAASAAAAAATADYIIQDVADPTILAPASLEAVCVRQGDKPLGFTVLPAAAAGGHHQLAHIRFGSPAHASGQVHDGDEIVQVGDQCVVGWSGEAVEALCRSTAVRTGELPLRLRRRGARPPPPARLAPHHVPLAPPPPPRAPTPPVDVAKEETKGDSSDESEALSPPASPTQLHLDHTRMYPPKPRPASQRRHSVSCGSPIAKRPNLSIEQFWRELKEQQCAAGARGGGGGAGGGSAGASPEPDAGALYRRDKAVSCSTGLELSPRPRTCLGVSLPPPPPSTPATPAPPPPPSPCRGKLDKSHSTPAYDLAAPDTGGALSAQPIPESPTTPAESPAPPAHPLHPPHPPSDTHTTHALNTALLEYADADPDAQVDTPPSTIPAAVNPFFPAPPSPPPRPSARPSAPPPPAPAPAPPLREFPALRIVPRAPDTPDKKEFSPLKPLRVSGAESPTLSGPVRHLTKHDIRVVSAERRPLPALNKDPDPPHTHAHSPAHTHTPAHSPQNTASVNNSNPVQPTHTSSSRGIFPSSKTRSLKKKNSLLAKRRMVSWRLVSARGVAGCVWQRVRSREGAMSRWARRHLLLAHNVLYAYRRRESSRADCMISLAGWAVCGAGEVRSKAHAFKVYHTGTAFYFAADTKDAMAAWLQLLQRATLAPPPQVMLFKVYHTGTAFYFAADTKDAMAAWLQLLQRATLAPPPQVMLFKVYHTGTAFYFAADTKDAMAAWLQLLQRATLAPPPQVMLFKVYHTGTAFYFAADTKDAMAAWLQLLQRATLAPPPQVDVSKQFSETEYSDTESDSEQPSRRERERTERDREREREKDKSKFGSLKKLTSRMGRSESSEAVAGAASLDRKCLRFFRSRHKDDKAKNKSVGVPVPTEHYRSYRRPPPDQLAPLPAALCLSPAEPDSKKLLAARPHASNPNLAAGGGEWARRGGGAGAGAGAGAVRGRSDFLGSMTLEEFMLRKQEEERKQVYTNRVLMGVERTAASNNQTARAQKDLQKQLEQIIPDVIYGELREDSPPPRHRATDKASAPEAAPILSPPAARALPPSPAPTPTPPSTGPKPISVKGKDGYEKLVYPEELGASPPSLAPERWRDSLRRNDKVHSGVSAGAPPPRALAPPAPAPASPPTTSSTVSTDSWVSPGGVQRLRLMFSSRAHPAPPTPAPAPGPAPAPAPAPPVAPRPQEPAARAASNGVPPGRASPPPGPTTLVGGLAVQYPHLQCPPTFQPETYTLSRAPVPAPQPPPPAQPPLSPQPPLTDVRRHHHHHHR